jgi:outer membrane immunogenic protein
MRRVGLVLAAFAFVQQAQAADLGPLRGAIPALGPPTYYRWDGFYGGAQWGYSSASVDFGNSTSSLIAFVLRNTAIESEAHVSEWTTLPTGVNTTARTAGGFFGYNAQWDSAIFGLEVNYNRGNIASTATDSIGRSHQTNDGYLYDVNVSASSSVIIKDYLTLRGRAAYAYGRFLPYLMAGFAIGRADVESSATVALVATDATAAGRPDLALGPTTKIDARKDVFTYGFSAGGGVDVALMPNMFLRGEYEYVQFTTNGIVAGISSVRAGLGVKY